MPYSHNSDLPENITRHLPVHAQTIYRKAFNAALDEYKDEVIAFKVAWAAVKQQYEKNEEGFWILKR